jgi:ABC-type branched-subunit amino acid transport system substrate-binding protein
MTFTRRTLLAAAGSALALSLSAPALAQNTAPIKVGGTLALTGPLSATAQIHKLVGEIYVEQLNARGGLLGRKVEWILKDDQSRPDVARTLYEQLVTVDKVDLLIGPYATGAILSAMGVAQRYNKVLVHHTFGIPSLAKYDMHFPTWAVGPNPETTYPNLVLDAMAASARPPQTVAIVTSKFPSVHFMSVGAREVAKKRGIKEVLYLEWEFGNKDFGAIASRIKEANPDFIWGGVIALEGVQLLDALKKIDYTPKNHFHYLPSPGPMEKSPEARNALAATIFEQHPPFTTFPGAAEFAKIYNERAKRANLPDIEVDTQAAASYSAWQVIEAGVKGTNSLDDKSIAAWLKKNPVQSIQGRLRYDGPNNYGDDLMRLKQNQNGKWVVVWPKEYAAPGVRLMQ